MKKLSILLVLLLAFTCLFTGCGKDTSKETVYNYKLETYDDLIKAEWTGFIGAVTLNEDEKYRIDESNSVKMKIDYSSVPSSYSRTTDMPVVPMVRFDVEEMGEVDINDIKQFSCDVYNAGIDDLYVILYVYYGRETYSLIYSDTVIAHKDRWTNCNFNVNRLFFQDCKQSMTNFSIGFFSNKLNEDGAVVYLDNVKVTTTTVKDTVEKTPEGTEILSFKTTDDFKYVSYIQNNIVYLYTAPTAYGYLSYKQLDEGYALTLNNFGTDGYCLNAADVFSVDEQGFGFYVNGDLLKKTSAGGNSKVLLNVKNNSLSPKNIMLTVGNANGKEVKKEVLLNGQESKEIYVKITDIGGVISSLKVMCDTWNMADVFSLEFTNIRYGE